MRGQFMAPLVSASEEGTTCISVNPAHQLFVVGTASGTLEFYDPRSRSRIAEAAATKGEVSAISCREDGLGLAVGTSEGKVMLWDLREHRPWITKDHHYNLPIKRVLWHSGGSDAEKHERVVSADAKVIRIWEPENVYFLINIRGNLLPP